MAGDFAAGALAFLAGVAFSVAATFADFALVVFEPDAGFGVAFWAAGNAAVGAFAGEALAFLAVGAFAVVAAFAGAAFFWGVVLVFFFSEVTGGGVAFFVDGVFVDVDGGAGVLSAGDRRPRRRLVWLVNRSSSLFPASFGSAGVFRFVATVTYFTSAGSRKTLVKCAGAP